MTSELHILAMLLRIDTRYECDTSHHPGIGDVLGTYATGNKDYSIQFW